MKNAYAGGDLSDREIVGLFWDRNEAAIPETDRKYGAFLFRIAHRILPDPGECEDCKNDTYLRVWRAIPPTKPAVLPAFLARIVRFVAVNRYREKTKASRVPAALTVSLEELRDALADGTDVAQSVEAAELGREINTFVSGLSGRRRTLFVSRYVFAEPVNEIAAALSISLPTAYRELEKIRQGLKTHLKRKGLLQ